MRRIEIGGIEELCKEFWKLFIGSDVGFSALYPGVRGKVGSWIPAHNDR